MGLRAFARRILDHLDEAVAIVRPQGGILHVNAAMAALLARVGLPPPEPGARVAEALGADGAGDALVRCLESGAGQSCQELRLRGPAGAVLVSAAILPLVGVDGVTLAAALVGRDVTDRARQAEEEARRGRLAAVGQLAAGAAHEIRNPLTAISGFLQLLAPLAPDGPPAKYLRIIREEVERIEHITADLLLLSRSWRVRLEPCDLGTALAAVAELVQLRAAAFGIALRVAVEPGLPPVVADPERLEQVLLNLVANALEAMAGPGGVDLLARSAEAGFAEVIVRDQGPGIPPDVLPHLFEPFFTTKAGGTGLGLAVTESIVRSFGGDISASSPPGEGATFRVRLPLAATRATTGARTLRESGGA